MSGNAVNYIFSLKRCLLLCQP